MTGHLHKIASGQNGRYFYDGIIAFVTTGTTVSLDVPFQTIHSICLTYVNAAAQAANGPLSCSNVPVTNGSGKQVIKAVSDAITIARAAGTDSGIAVSFQIWGE